MNGKRVKVMRMTTMRERERLNLAFDDGMRNDDDDNEQQCDSLFLSDG